MSPSLTCTALRTLLPKHTAIYLLSSFCFDIDIFVDIKIHRNKINENPLLTTKELFLYNLEMKFVRSNDLIKTK